MKASLVLLCASLIALQSHARQEATPALEGDPREIAWAIKVLVESGALQFDSAHNSYVIQPSLVEQLRAAGVIKKKNSELAAICPDGGH